MSRRSVSTATQAPHSWDLEHWPQDVYPHSESRARYLVRAYRSELMTAGALVRVGRELVVMGDRYSRWLQSKATEVPGYATNATPATATGA